MMKKIFYLGILGLLLFEIANVYFIMPMPGSQRMNSIDLAYFLYSYRWIFRIAFAIMIIAGLIPVFRNTRVISKVFAVICLLLLGAVVYAANFMMAADAMFVQSKNFKMNPAAENKIDSNRIVIGIEFNGQAKAYPIQFLGYHHQVFDSIGNKPVIVTYCTVCRTGRVFEPVVNGKVENFRLVGMDHFNAMFEDKTTKSWWRQATGEAIAGKLKGYSLPELNSTQMELKQWLSLYPNSLIMQEDPDFTSIYDGMSNYENGTRTGMLTRRDTLPWQEKSWIAGVIVGKESKAYDWIALQKQRIIYDVLDNLPIVIVLADDNKSFVALKRTDANQHFSLQQDTLSDSKNIYSLTGRSFDPAVPDLVKINAYQEYWHSWRTFHPHTKK